MEMDGILQQRSPLEKRVSEEAEESNKGLWAPSKDGLQWYSRVREKAVGAF